MKKLLFLIGLLAMSGCHIIRPMLQTGDTMTSPERLYLPAPAPPLEPLSHLRFVPLPPPEKIPF